MKRKPIAKPSDQVGAFVKMLKSGSYSRNPREKFNDFLEMSFCALACATASSQERLDELKKRIERVRGKYTDRDAVFINETYFQMLHLIGEVFELGGCGDFLGDVAAHLGALNESSAQFFTPFHVSMLLASMLLDEVSTRLCIEQHGYITIGEPASGSCGMVLACADVLQQQGYTTQINMLAHTTDIDKNAFYMSYIQLSLRGVPALVIHGDSLSQKVFEQAWTIHADSFYKHHGHINFTAPRPMQMAMF